MRWLIYGAGNIGSLYAARLAGGSNEVSILARGSRLAEIRERGIELEDGLTGQRSTTRVKAVERLEPHDAYDVTMVILPKHRIDDVLPILAKHEGTPSVIFFGNNAAGPDAMVDALGRDRVLFGFPGAAGVRRDGRIRYVITSAREQPTTIGELDGSKSPRVVAIEQALEAAGFPVSISPAIDAWLKTHVAKVLPTLCALHRAGLDPKRLASDDQGLQLMLDSIREGFEVLSANGIPITPANHRVFGWVPQRLLRWVMRKMLRAESTEIKLGHASGGLGEWRLLAREFEALIGRTEVPTPATHTLFRELDLERDTEPDGPSREPHPPQA